MSKYKGFTDSELVVLFHRFDLCTHQIASNVSDFLGFNPRLGGQQQADWFEKALALDVKEENSIFAEVREELQARGVDPFILN